MGYNYKQIAESVVKCIGGQKNIKSVQHCATRLRLIVVDKEKIDEKGMGDIEGVKGTFFTAGQFQIIFGTGHVNRVYEEVTKLGINETTESEAKEAKMDGKNRLQKAIRIRNIIRQ